MIAFRPHLHAASDALPSALVRPPCVGRYTEIERENRILLEKMSNIMQNSKPSLYNPKRIEKSSLNRVQRKKELMKITVEN